MSTVALQITPSGILWAVIPEPLSLDGDNPVAAGTMPWPVSRRPRPDRLPLDIEERVLAYQALLTLLADLGAEDVLLAVEDGVDRIRVGVVEVVLDHADVRVVTVAAHDEGAIGIVGEAVDGMVSGPRF